ncbi:TonB-dependent receptor, partial [Pseudomonas sp. FW305-130]
YQAAQIDLTRPTLGNFLGNAARVRLRGVELEGEAKLGGGFSASLNGSFNDATYRSYTNAPAPIEFSNVVSTVDLSGKRVIGSSKWTGQASLNYDAPIS